MQVEYDKLFSILRMEPEVEIFINPFITAYLNDAMEQLEGQIAGAKIAMARLSSPHLYYIMTGKLIHALTSTIRLSQRYFVRAITLRRFRLMGLYSPYI